MMQSLEVFLPALMRAGSGYKYVHLLYSCTLGVGTKDVFFAHS